MRRLALGLALAAALGVAACSSSKASGPETNVTATDTECRVSNTSLSSGDNTLVIENKGSEVTEVYVYGAGDKVITEKEDIGPGTTVRAGVSLQPGTYQIACKPGMKGTGIRETVTVAAAAPATSAP